MFQNFPMVVQNSLKAFNHFLNFLKITKLPKIAEENLKLLDLFCALSLAVILVVDTARTCHWFLLLCLVQPA